MRELPILFNGPMVRAVLEGRKTQTRRLANPQPHTVDSDGRWYRMPSGGLSLNCHRSPYGFPGDRLWVREPWRTLDYLDPYSGAEIADRCLDAGYAKPWAPLQFEADCARIRWEHTASPPHAGEPAAGRYRHARFMPRWASRIVLEVTGVRMERLQSINDTDAEAEGVAEWAQGALSAEGQTADPSDQFRWLWDSINGPDSWSNNPWVWVIEFQRLEAARG